MNRRDGRPFDTLRAGRFEGLGGRVAVAAAWLGAVAGLGHERYCEVSSGDDMTCEPAWLTMTGNFPARADRPMDFRSRKRAYGYMPFGSPYAPGTNVTVPQRYTYTGREKNPVSSLMYYRYRQYDPKVGRFGGRDPLWGMCLRADRHIAYGVLVGDDFQYEVLAVLDDAGVHAPRALSQLRASWPFMMREVPEEDARSCQNFISAGACVTRAATSGISCTTAQLPRSADAIVARDESVFRNEGDAYSYVGAEVITHNDPYGLHPVDCVVCAVCTTAVYAVYAKSGGGGVDAEFAASCTEHCVCCGKDLQSFLSWLIPDRRSDPGYVPFEWPADPEDQYRSIQLILGDTDAFAF